MSYTSLVNHTVETSHMNTIIFWFNFLCLHLTHAKQKLIPIALGTATTNLFMLSFLLHFIFCYIFSYNALCCVVFSLTMLYVVLSFILQCFMVCCLFLIMLYVVLSFLLQCFMFCYLFSYNALCYVVFF